MRLKVYRYHEGMASPHYDVFELKPRLGMTVLEALFRFQEELDDSLAFHYSCRGAVCGTCAMLINKVPRLACRTQLELLRTGKLDVSLADYPAIRETVKWNPDKEVLVEPLPHLPVIRDLVVDMDIFFRYYRFIRPQLEPQDASPEKERAMNPIAVKKLETYTNCVLCAACHAACPVPEKNPRYLGPAALAKLYRFCIDPRQADGSSTLKRADMVDGWWACEMYGNCNRVCPKGVPPRTAIAKAVAALSKERREADEQN
jgi:succinate dehydrogenase iron-sulfur subunit